jgi:hypothetical protein
MLAIGVEREVMLCILEEVKSEIKHNGICNNERALLFHQLGTIHGLFGNSHKQRIAWQEALELDPKSDMIRESLKSLE